MARLLGAKARNVALVQNSTVAFAQAISAFDLGPGDVILTSRSDYASNQIMYLSLARRRGVEIVRAPDAPEGGVDPDAVRKLIARRRPTLVALTWIPTNSGLVQPVEAVGRICREAGVPYLIDGCQAVGQLPIEVEQLHCDYLSGTARKFLRGPRGLGFLYVVRRGAPEGSPSSAGRHARRGLDRCRRVRAQSRRPALRDLGVCLRPGAGSGRRGRVCAERRGWRLLAGSGPGAGSLCPRSAGRTSPGFGCSTGGPSCAPS